MNEYEEADARHEARMDRQEEDRENVFQRWLDGLSGADRAELQHEFLMTNCDVRLRLMKFLREHYWSYVHDHE